MELTYQYNEASSVTKENDKSNIFLAHYNEAVKKEEETPCFFWGKLKEPYTIARSLLTLSKIVAANFMPNSSLLRDPVITAGGNKLRLEAFSSCCSVYGKVYRKERICDAKKGSKSSREKSLATFKVDQRDGYCPIA